MTLLNRILLMAAVLGFSVGCDQATKAVAVATLEGKPTQSFLLDTFRLSFAKNEGAFLSLGARLPEQTRFWLLTGAVGVLLMGIVAFALRNSKLNPQQVSGYAMIAGGGLSNW